MAWTNIVVTLVMLIALTYLVQWLVPSTRGRPGAARQYIQHDVAPILGFFGLVLLALSFVEALRLLAMLAWALGAAFGLVAALGLWIALTFWWGLPRPTEQRRTSPVRILFRIVRTYGIVILVGLLGLNIGVRLFGPAVEMFISGALGVLVIGAAAAVFRRVAGQE